ncbi:MAG: ATPase [Spirochaetaceae bacterium]|nr:ATPase [Spirochaetaceae bacterium]
MAKTAEMRLIELMIMKQDVDPVIEYLGKKGVFQFYSQLKESSSNVPNTSKEVFDKLQLIRAYLNINDIDDYNCNPSKPSDADFREASEIIRNTDEIREKGLQLADELKKLKEAYQEALSFVNLKVSYSELEHLSFLTMRIGKIDPDVLESMRFSLGERAIIIPLGEDNSRIMVATSRKARFALDAELKKFGFIPLEIPKDFKGIPDDMLEGMKQQLEDKQTEINAIEEQRVSFAKTHEEKLLKLLQIFSVGMQVQILRDKLEATELVYRIVGWIPVFETDNLVKDLDNLTEGRIAVRQYQPDEIPSVQKGREQVPVKLKHGKFIKSFEGLILGYGAPKYGTIDPTPFVAAFFILLFGIMFGDAGQGLVFVLIGLLLHFNLVTVKGWNKYGLIFIAIGCSSFIMGLLTGEFFTNEELLKPFSYFVTGLFVGKEKAFAPILHLMPSKETMPLVFIFFGFTLSVGFIINSVGLVLNFINNVSLKKWGHAFFGKTGLCGAVFFWYTIALAVRIAAFHHKIALYDWIIIGVSLLGVFFAHPLERLCEHEKPCFENGLGVGIIEGVVELLDVVSNYLSNTVSFLRVGAFALAHVVLGYIICTMNEMLGGIGGLAVLIIGNAVVIVLEGMIVAIQVIRLQYYEFFSKFFTETGVEFKPFQFKYKS